MSVSLGPLRRLLRTALVCLALLGVGLPAATFVGMASHLCDPADPACDATPPTPVSVTLATPTYDNPDTQVRYSSVAPVWTWTPATDPEGSGPVSGIAGYDVELNGNQVGRVTGTQFGGSLVPGWQCLRARAIDNAGNLAAWSGEECVFVDAQAPFLALYPPGPGHLHHEGEQIRVNHLPPGIHSVVIGTLQMTAFASDVGSHLHTIAVSVTPAEGGPAVFASACDDLNARQTRCSWWDEGDGLDPTGLHRLTLTGTAWDNANNPTTRDTTYLRAPVAVVEMPCRVGLYQTCPRVLIASGIGGAGSTYVVTWSRDPSFPAFGTRLVGATPGGVALPAVEDPNPRYLGEPIYYQTTVVTAGGDTIVLPTVRLNYSGWEGNLGTWV